MGVMLLSSGNDTSWEQWLVTVGMVSRNCDGSRVSCLFAHQDAIVECLTGLQSRQRLHSVFYDHEGTIGGCSEVVCAARPSVGVSWGGAMVFHGPKSHPSFLYGLLRKLR